MSPFSVRIWPWYPARGTAPRSTLSLGFSPPIPCSISIAASSG